MSRIKVSVIVPIRNEEMHISACLRSLLEQTYPSDLCEVIVVDGMSSDRSLEIVEGFCRRHANLRCLNNHAAIVPCGMNIGIRVAHGEVIIRADGHNVYPPDYVENCVRYLNQTAADNVGGPLLTVPTDASLGAHLVAAVLTNPFGVGDSRFRIGSTEGFVDTVPFGAFRRDLFDRVGMYNEKLVRNQDNELNARIRAAGGKIFQTPALRTEYHPPAGFWKLLHTTMLTSQWHLFSLKENPGSMGIRHLTPALFVVSVVGLSLASPWSRAAFVSLLVLLLVYLSLGVHFAIRRSRSYGPLVVSTLPFACLFFHLSYGLGTLAGVRYLFEPPSSRPIREGQPIS